MALSYLVKGPIHPEFNFNMLPEVLHQNCKTVARHSLFRRRRRNNGRAKGVKGERQGRSPEIEVEKEARACKNRDLHEKEVERRKVIALSSHLASVQLAPEMGPSVNVLEEYGP